MLVHASLQLSSNVDRQAAACAYFTSGAFSTYVLTTATARVAYGRLCESGQA